MPKPTNHRGVNIIIDATPAQKEFLAILLNDCGYSTTAQRKDFLYSRFKVNFTDELTKAQAGQAIAELTQQRDQIQGRIG